MNRYHILLIAAVVLLLTTGCSTNQSIGTQLDDAAISTKVKAKLAADPQINPFDIDVDTNEGVVRLSGAVNNDAVRDEAVKLARRTKGVVRVVNDLTIGNRSLGDRLDDAGIVASIKAKLTGDPQVHPFNVDVDSKDGVVTLSGRVETVAARNEAEKIARNTEGVKEVRNRIKLGNENAG